MKKTASGSALDPDCEEAASYTGAKPHFVIDRVNDKERMTRFIRAIYDELPVPKPEKRRQTG